MQYLSFPGLGIEPFHIDRVAFTVFGRDVAWYGIIITCGMILAVAFAMYAAKHEKIPYDDIYDLALLVIIFGVLGARAYYVIFSWNEFNYVSTGGTALENIWNTIYNCIAIWDGGLAIYGGIIAGLITSYIFARRRKIQFLKIFDILVPCVLIGQVLGRWGNFINIEAYGSETTLPWRMGIHYSFLGTGIETGVWDSVKYVHPTFLYESLWNLIALAIIAPLYKKKKFNGMFFCMYLVWYGFGRMLIEGLRTDSLMLGPVRISQLVGLTSVIIGVIMFIILYKKYRSAASVEHSAGELIIDSDSDSSSEEK